MNGLMIGTLFKFRNLDNTLPIARDRFSRLIETSYYKLHRPYVVFYSDDKVYYLSVKTLKKGNEASIYRNQDKNVILLNKTVYDEPVKGEAIGNVIDCSVVNIMDRKLFEQLYQEDEYYNNYQLAPWIYDEVMNKLYENKDNLIVHQFKAFDFENNKTLWYETTKSNDKQNSNDNNKWLVRAKKVITTVIETYHSISRDEIEKRLNNQDEYVKYISPIYYNELEDVYNFFEIDDKWEEYQRSNSNKHKM
ncbi:integrative conjugal element protein [Mycoplasma mycoides subsp. capri]|uniref:Mbov_0400 family ICE element protein n=1 Tax=Mycoplasma mycoides TaxID=2102 RepID=UPI00223F4430|nr:integrative conjugal element protein [Mycoplasma mycoides]QVJ96689.1 integrative conjugal element protein [Mycoplasma mycoides subsp. capri]QVJ97581.1 integrative conjugal element protein [Mycoplasma mycoides subsp. capri]QVK00574.1 integrative conjugal element protein [Mycoplasma mycoides subsp. capri]QVK01461.1 integrative conjugal element protein [Mycoplasma mycoides subsp. capri]